MVGAEIFFHQPNNGKAELANWQIADDVIRGDSGVDDDINVDYCNEMWRVMIMLTTREMRQ